MSIFDVKEIFNFAIRIEENGERFYRTYAEKLGDEKIREIFTNLANDEVQHKKIFSKMLSEIGEFTPAERYPGEYTEYMNAYLKNAIFGSKASNEAEEKVKDVLSAINFGIDRELDSMLFYHEIKNFIPQQQNELIDKIIAEERKHFLRLVELKGKI